MREATRTTHRALIEGALAFIERNLDGEVGLRELADRGGVSAFHFHRVFSSIVGEPPAAYVRRLRLERAALKLMYHSRHSVTELAFEAGYETHESFTRAFKERFGVAPRCYRAQSAVVEPVAAVEPEIVSVPPRRIAYVRHVGPYDQTQEAFGKLLQWAGPRGLLGGATLLGVYWDDQRVTAPERTRCEIGIVVDDYATGEGEVGVRRLDGGEYVVCRHHGSSDDRRRLYDLVYSRWLPARGREPANAPPIELYSTFRGGLEGIDLVTSVHVPLAPRRAA